MDMVQVFIDINELQQATGLYNKFPTLDKKSDTGKALLGQLTFQYLAGKTEGKTALKARIDSNENDYEAYFDLAICLVTEHDYQQSMDSLFEMLTRDPEFKEDTAREMIVTLTDMLDANEPQLAKEFRCRLASMMSQLFLLYRHIH